MVRKVHEVPKSIYSDDNELHRKLKAIESPIINQAIRDMWEQFKDYEVPIEELQATLDEELGEHSFVEELYRMREGR